MEEKLIDNRIPVDTEVAPVQIREEDFELLKEVGAKANELDQIRSELGRICQIEHNLVDKTDKAEKALTEKRKELSSKYTLPVDGSWVIDFEHKEFVKVEKRVPKTV